MFWLMMLMGWFNGFGRAHRSFESSLTSVPMSKHDGGGTFPPPAPKP